MVSVLVLLGAFASLVDAVMMRNEATTRA